MPAKWQFMAMYWVRKNVENSAYARLGNCPSKNGKITMNHETWENYKLKPDENLDIKFKQQVGAAKLQPQKHNDFTRIRHFTTNAKDCWIRESSLKMADFNLLLFSNLLCFVNVPSPRGLSHLWNFQAMFRKYLTKPWMSTFRWCFALQIDTLVLLYYYMVD